MLNYFWVIRNADFDEDAKVLEKVTEDPVYRSSVLNMDQSISGRLLSRTRLGATPVRRRK